MFKNPEELMYSKTHEWVKKEDDLCIIGITDYAQDALGDIVFANLPSVGDEVKAGQAFGDVESVKAVSDIYSPVSGKVVEINEELLDNPALINEDSYNAWLIKVNEVSDEEELLNAQDYALHCEKEG